MNLMMIWHQYLDYRGLEGMARSLVDLGIIPYYGDYTTVWHRYCYIYILLSIMDAESLYLKLLRHFSLILFAILSLS